MRHLPQHQPDAYSPWTKPVFGLWTKPVFGLFGAVHVISSCPLWNFLWRIAASTHNLHLVTDHTTVLLTA